MSPGLRQERSGRVRKAKDESQSVFDTVAPEEEKTEKKESTPSVGVSRQSDHVRKYPSIGTQLAHSSITLVTAQILYGKFQNLTQEAQQTRSSNFGKAYRLCHFADDVQRETSEQAHPKHARRCQVARNIKRHRQQEDGHRYGGIYSITCLRCLTLGPLRTQS